MAVGRTRKSQNKIPSSLHKKTEEDVTNKKNSSDQKYKGNERANEQLSGEREFQEGTTEANFLRQEPVLCSKGGGGGCNDWSSISRGRRNGDEIRDLGKFQII